MDNEVHSIFFCECSYQLHEIKKACFKIDVTLCQVDDILKEIMINLPVAPCFPTKAIVEDKE